MIRVNPALVEDRKNSGFSGLGTAKSPALKTRKKTSGTLYSVFKEPDPRGSHPADDAVPPAFSETGFPSKDGNSSLSDFPRSVKDLDRPAPRADTNPHRDEGLKKNQEPLRGMRNIGCACAIYGPPPTLSRTFSGTRQVQVSQLFKAYRLAQDPVQEKALDGELLESRGSRWQVSQAAESGTPTGLEERKRSWTNAITAIERALSMELHEQVEFR